MLKIVGLPTGFVVWAASPEAKSFEGQIRGVELGRREMKCRAEEMAGGKILEKILAVDFFSNNIWIRIMIIDM
jgi:hypothetical protein